MSKRQAEAKLHTSQAEADAIKLELEAKATALKAEVEAIGGSEVYARIQEAAERAKIVLPTTMISGGSSGGSSGFAELLMLKMAGIEETQPQQITDPQPEFTVEQIDVFVKALGGYIQEGGAEKIRNALLPLASASNAPSYQVTDNQSTVQLPAKQQSSQTNGAI